MRAANRVILIALLIAGGINFASAQTTTPQQMSRLAQSHGSASEPSPTYRQVQQRLAQGWNSWDVNSVTTEVLLPDGLAIHAGLKHNTTESSDAFLKDALIGRLEPGAEQVFPGPHSWDGGYTELKLTWKGHSWRMQGANDNGMLVWLATPLPSKATSALPATIVFSVDYLWNRPGVATKRGDVIEARGPSRTVPVYCTCASPAQDTYIDQPLGGPYFAADLVQPVGISSGKRLTVAEIQAVIARHQNTYRQSIAAAGQNGPILDAIETTLGWDTIYEPSKSRVVSPVSRVWSVRWGGYVIFDWDTFFAATMAAIGDKDLAYADAIETLRESTAQGFVPNYARAGGWSSFDRSEPPVGAITVLGLYRRYRERWFLEDTFTPLLRWNRWWAGHRDIQGYLTWGSDGANAPGNLDDTTRGTRAGAILESGLDNSPMYDGTTYNTKSHLLEFADVGLMSLYIADCDALAEIAQALDAHAEAKELKDRATRYRAKLATLWDERAGIFLNKDLHTEKSGTRLSPTNFYPMLAHAATPAQVRAMIEKHLRNPKEFWGDWIIPSIARNDPAFGDQDYWRGRIWGPMNYLVYLGLRNYAEPAMRAEFAQKSYDLFLKEWTGNGHVHENYNAKTGTGDDVANSDRFYHWGALLGYIAYLERAAVTDASGPSPK
jgi:hypothetical protein